MYIYYIYIFNVYIYYVYIYYPLINIYMSIDLVYTLKTKEKKFKKIFKNLFFCDNIFIRWDTTYQKKFRGENMNSKLIDLLENINDLLFDESININKPEIRQEIKFIIEQVQNELNEDY